MIATFQEVSRARLLFAAIGCGLVFASGAVFASPADEAPPAPRPVRSDSGTASTGRRPLSARIAMAVVEPSLVKPAEPTLAKSAEPTLATPEAVDGPQGDSATSTPQTSTKQDDGNEPAKTSTPSDSTADNEPPVAPEPEPIASTPRAPRRAAANQSATVPPQSATKPAIDRGSLLEKVKSRLAAMGDGAVAAAGRAEPPRLGFAEPPRLGLEVEESRVESRVGETLTWHIRIRNAGGTAHDVATTLFFADGVEPMRASGAKTVVSPGEVRFAAVERVAAGQTVELTVVGRAVHAGPVVSRAEVTCREIPGSIAREGVVVIRSR